MDLSRLPKAMLVLVLPVLVVAIGCGGNGDSAPDSSQQQPDQQQQQPSGDDVGVPDIEGLPPVDGSEGDSQ